MPRARRFIGPAKTFVAKRIAARSSDRQSSSEVCAIPITAREPGIFVAASAVPHRKNCKIELFRETHRLRARIKAGKMGRGHLLASDLVSHKAGYGHPQDDKGDLAVFLVAARRVKVWELGPGA